MSSSLGLQRVPGLERLQNIACGGKRDNAGVAERVGEQLRKTSVHKKCVYQEGGRKAPREKCEVLPGERRRNSLIYELDVLILAEEKMVKSFEMLLSLV